MQEPITCITCDGCGLTVDETFGTAKKVRQQLKQYGWVNYGVLDYCQYCSDSVRAKERKSMFNDETL